MRTPFIAELPNLTW